MSEDWVKDVLSFWFEELTSENWFQPSDEVDAKIRDRFGALYDHLKSSPPKIDGSDSDSALAAILVLDQFPRNMFRGTAAAFGSDNIAAALSREAVDAGLDTGLGKEAAAFLYMPLMHSESLADQERGVMLFRALPGAEENVKYAIDHRDVIAKFGRFPHRNRALGRESTPDELEYLKSGSRYGQ